MGNKHERKFFVNMLIGLIFTTGGVFSIVYSCFMRSQQQDWVFWAIIATIAINSGLLFLGSGVVHKVKADLIRRQKQKSGRGERMSMD